MSLGAGDCQQDTRLFVYHSILSQAENWSNLKKFSAVRLKQKVIKINSIKNIIKV